MVGDLDHDVSAAKSAKGTSILVKRNPNEKTDFEADYVVHSLSEILKIIQEEKRKPYDCCREGC
jgi:phosphoglycolate phosphatase-like HAD superfamily hydrolase